MSAVTYLTHTQNEDVQTGEELSYIGGKPHLPEGISIPITKKTGSEMTFFFQVTFPLHHVWHGLTLSLFACTDYSDEDQLIPAMLDGDLCNIKIPINFLTKYQKYFRYFVFETSQGKLRTEYQEIIQFNKLEFKENPFENETIWGSISDQPLWLLDDESPSVYSENIPMTFLFQTKLEYAYKKRINAPRQIIFDDMSNSLGSSYKDDYDLFLGNECYYFGTATGEHLVYILTQVD